MADKDDSALTGKLLVLSPWPVAEDLGALQARYAGLTVEVIKVAWLQVESPIPEAAWADVVVLVTGSCLPAPGWAPRLQYVQLLSAGANHVAQHPVFLDESIVFCGANGVHGPQISEWVIATYLGAKHRLHRYRQLQDAQEWRQGYGEPLVEDAFGRCVGILGYGAIGRQTACLARALGMTVHAYTLHPRDTPASRREDNAYVPAGLGDVAGELPARWFSGGSRADIHAFLGSGLDLLVVALPLTEATRGLLGADELAVLAPRRTFVANIARGAIVDTAALIDALNADRLSGAALDVTDPEPLPKGHPLWTAKNVIITPHISGSSTAYLERVLAILDTNLQRLQQGAVAGKREQLLNELSKTAGY